MEVNQEITIPGTTRALEEVYVYLLGLKHGADIYGLESSAPELYKLICDIELSAKESINRHVYKPERFLSICDTNATMMAVNSFWTLEIDYLDLDGEPDDAA